MATRKRRVITKTPEKQILSIQDGEVVMNVVPEEVMEVDVDAEVENAGSPRVKFSTPLGEAVYEYAGNCVDCMNKRESVETPVFTCKSSPIRADEQLGNQLASFRRDGKSASALCQDCYEAWQGQKPKREARFKVL